MNFTINVNQNQSQTIKHDNFQIHLSKKFENDLNKNLTLKTFSNIILKRFRRREVDKRCTFIEQFIEIEKQKKFI